MTEISTPNQAPASSTVVLPVAPLRRTQLIGLSLAGLLGGAALAFILFNVYQGLYSVKALSAVVVGPSVTLNAAQNGVFRSDLAPEVTVVEKGQLLGQVVGENESATPVASTCDCVITARAAHDGQPIQAGSPVITLVPLEAVPWITALVDSRRAMRMEKDTRANVHVAGNAKTYQGRVAAINANNITPDADGLIPPAEVKILLDQKLPADFTGRPAQATFFLK